jgi:hypothetical protein
MTQFEHIDDKFDFGKFSGCTLGEVLTFNPEYVDWVLKNVSGRICIIEDSAIQEIKLIFPNFMITKEFERYRIMRIYEYEGVEEESCDDDYDYYDNYDIYTEQLTYGRYSGSYAQDEMGYSDDDIDTIFDGDPSAYWNID